MELWCVKVYLNEAFIFSADAFETKEDAAEYAHNWCVKNGFTGTDIVVYKKKMSIGMITACAMSRAML